jgi:phytoene/squalene synthetase
VLHLFDCADESTVPLSDNLCTALQLANFWQDVSVDLARGRLYIPLEDCERFGYTEDDLTARRVNDPFRRLMRFEVERTRDLFEAAMPLLTLVGRRLGFELALTAQGGRTILAMVEKLNYDVLTVRPVLGFAAKLGILARTLKDGVR